MWPRNEVPANFNPAHNDLGMDFHYNCLLITSSVFQQIDIDSVQGSVHDDLSLPHRPSNVPVMRLFGVTNVHTVYSLDL